ncbi:MAG: glycosyltransferase family 39 protein [Bacteroidia bacterium]|nr:glycosyltransferase family 39 protein [Bacteroidia bacterium]
MKNLLKNKFWLRLWLPVIIFAALAYFPLFLHLGSQPLKNFDESLFALRAYRIAHDGQYLNNFIEFPDGPSATNTKPPFFSGIQALSYKLWGYNELALRLPVALSVAALLFFMLRFSRQETGNFTFGIFSGMVLLTSWGFIHVHVSRTGDHDAPLAVLGWLALTYLYRFLKYNRQYSRHLIVFTGAILAATLTKSVAGLFMVPGIGVWLIAEKQFLPLLRDRRTWIALGSYILIVGGYYLYRELDYPGFWKGMWKGELGGHYLQTRDGHLWPFYWFAMRLYTHKFLPWLFFLPIGFFLILQKNTDTLRRYGWLNLLGFISWLMVISLSQTKLEWYDASLYPLMAMPVGYALYRLYEGGKSFLPDTARLTPVLWAVLFVFAFFFTPGVAVMKKVYQPHDIDYPGERYGYLIKQVEKQFPDLKKYTILHEGHSTHALFYQLTRNDKGFDISRLHTTTDTKAGDIIMACQPEVIRYLKEHFQLRPISGKEGCELLELLDEIPTGE